MVADARAVINDGGGRMWLATAKGLRVFARPTPARRHWARALLADDEILHLTLDRFGRVWALGPRGHHDHRSHWA